MNFTYKNHLQYFIGDNLYGSRTNSTESFTVKVGNIDKEHFRKSNYQQELLRVSDLIYQNFGKNFALFLSGGTDSEIVARSFLKIGIKPTCVTIKFKNGYNNDDVTYSEQLANELGLPLQIIDFDVKDFFYSGEAENFGNKLQCAQVTYLLIYYCIQKIGLPSVMGGELLLRRNINTNPSSWYYCFRENEDASAMRFSHLTGVPLINEFFSYTPEIMLYYLQHPKIQSLVSNRYNYKLASVSSKNQILKELLPEIELRKKTHGFENLLAFNFEVYRKLANKQIMRLEPSLDGIEYHKCIGMLKGEI